MKIKVIFRATVFILFICASGFAQKSTPLPTPQNQKTGPSADGQWKEFVSKEGKCKVLVPGVVSDESVQSEYVANEKQYTYVVRTGYVFIQLGFSKIPVAPEFEDETVMKSFYDKYIANMAKNDNMTILAQSDFRIGNAFGREATFGEGEMVHINRYILRNQTLYLVFTMTYKENHSDAAVTRLRRKFLDSFQFVD